jgi:hypothetical protein
VGDGAVSATATVTTFTGLTIGSNPPVNGIQITLTNLLSSAPGGDGLAISGINFKVANSTLAAGLAGLVQDQGQEISIAKTAKHATNAVGTPGSVVTGNSPNFFHWGEGVKSGVTYLETVDSGGGFAAAKPNHLIAPQTTGNLYHSDSWNQHDKSFLQSATFWIVDSAVTTSTSLTLSDFSGVQLKFGTGQTGFIDTTGMQSPSQVPEPASLTLLGCFALSCATAYCWRRRTQPKP